MKHLFSTFCLSYLCVNNPQIKSRSGRGTPATIQGFGCTQVLGYIRWPLAVLGRADPELQQAQTELPAEKGGGRPQLLSCQGSPEPLPFAPGNQMPCLRVTGKREFWMAAFFLFCFLNQKREDGIGCSAKMLLCAFRRQANWWKSELSSSLGTFIWLRAKKKPMMHENLLEHVVHRPAWSRKASMILEEPLKTSTEQREGTGNAIEVRRTHSTRHLWAKGACTTQRPEPRLQQAEVCIKQTLADLCGSTAAFLIAAVIFPFIFSPTKSSAESLPLISPCTDLSDFYFFPAAYGHWGYSLSHFCVQLHPFFF